MSYNKKIYVVSTETMAAEDKYKIGNWRNEQKQLLSRYHTAIIDPDIFYYRYVTNWQLIDKQIRIKLDKYRVKDKSGGNTEWFNLNLTDIILCIDKIIKKYDNNPKNIINNKVSKKKIIDVNDTISNDDDIISNDDDTISIDDIVEAKKPFCSKCKTVFETQSNLNRHIRTSACAVGSKTSKKFSCKFCKKTDTRRDNLNTHMEICSLNPKVIKNKKLLAKNTNISKNSDSTINVGNKTKNIRQINNIIITKPITNNRLVVFGKETEKGFHSLLVLSSELSILFDKKNNCMQEYIKLIYLSPNRPQFHNVLYTNLSSSYVLCYTENGWETKKINDIINAILDTKIPDLLSIEKIMPFIKREILDGIKVLVADLSINQHKNRKIFISYIKCVFYDRRNMILKTKLKHENNNFNNFSDEEGDISNDTM